MIRSCLTPVFLCPYCSKEWSSDRSWEETQVSIIWPKHCYQGNYWFCFCACTHTHTTPHTHTRTHTHTHTHTHTLYTCTHSHTHTCTHTHTTHAHTHNITQHTYSYNYYVQCTTLITVHHHCERIVLDYMQRFTLSYVSSCLKLKLKRKSRQDVFSYHYQHN